MPVQGLIGYHGLEAWWLGELTGGERERLETLFKPLGASNPRPKGSSCSSQLRSPSAVIGAESKVARERPNGA